MRLLLANNRYFVSGGPDRYMLRIQGQMESRGHDVVPYAVRYPQSLPSPYAKYWKNPIGSGVYFRDLKLNIIQRMQFAFDTIYSSETVRTVSHLLDDHPCDLAYLLHIVNYVSPSILAELDRRHIPIVVRLSDYHLLCPAYTFRREGRPCEDCVRKSLWQGVRHRCLQGSRGVTLVRALGMKVHRLLHLWEKARYLVTPSEFLRSKLVDFGFPAPKIVHLPSLVEIPSEPSTVPGEYFLHLGRVVPEKGTAEIIHALALQKKRLPLIIVGDLGGAYSEECHRLVEALGLAEWVRFAGFASNAEVVDLIRGARAVIHPSLWYENCPLAVYEAQSHGKAVVVTDLGSMREQVEHGRDGLLVSPERVVEDLAARMDLLAQDPDLAGELGQRGRERVMACNAPDKHVAGLLSIFDHACRG